MQFASTVSIRVGFEALGRLDKNDEENPVKEL